MGNYTKRTNLAPRREITTVSVRGEKKKIAALRENKFNPSAAFRYGLNFFYEHPHEAREWITAQEQAVALAEWQRGTQKGPGGRPK